LYIKTSEFLYIYVHNIVFFSNVKRKWRSGKSDICSLLWLEAMYNKNYENNEFWIIFYRSWRFEKCTFAIFVIFTILLSEWVDCFGKKRFFVEREQSHLPDTCTFVNVQGDMNRVTRWVCEKVNHNVAQSIPSHTYLLPC
jgi:hypothetical protein